MWRRISLEGTYHTCATAASTCDQCSRSLSFSKSVKEYIGKKLTLALVLNRDQKEAISANNPEDPEATIVQSTFNILNMCVETKWKNGRSLLLMQVLSALLH